jgi:hypothetical protein
VQQRKILRITVLHEAHGRQVEDMLSSISLPTLPRVGTPCGHIPDSETRRRRAAALYEVETGFREEGWPSEEFVYDEEHDLYRFADGEFAFSREYANERRLREMGCSG